MNLSWELPVCWHHFLCPCRPCGAGKEDDGGRCVAVSRRAGVGPGDLRRPVEGRGRTCAAEPTECRRPAPQPQEQHQLSLNAAQTLQGHRHSVGNYRQQEGRLLLSEPNQHVSIVTLKSRFNVNLKEAARNWESLFSQTHHRLFFSFLLLLAQKVNHI